MAAYSAGGLSQMKGKYPPFAPRASLRYDVVRRMVRDLEPRTVLEIGCGQGAFGARISEAAKYVGLEPDEGSYATAVRRIAPRGGQVVCGTTDSLPDGSAFDLVCAFEVLEHLEHDEDALVEWVGLVRPGGHLMLSVPAFQERYGATDARAGHIRRYEPHDLKRKLVATGLEDVKVTVYAWPLGYALEAVRNRIDARKLGRARPLPNEELTSASGRTRQPSTQLVGIGIAVAAAPFRYLQRIRPKAGTGLVAVGRRPIRTDSSVSWQSPGSASRPFS
jgi:SAM-dependent methyltransferase